MSKSPLKLFGILMSMPLGKNSQILKTLFLMKIFSEIQIHYSFPNFQFFAEDNTIVRKDKNKSGGGLILYISDSIPGKIIHTHHFIKT